MLALERQAKDANIILIEEPENHLSFTSMNMLINKIREKCAGKQIIIVTHSAYVLNKLGIEKVIFLPRNQAFHAKESARQHAVILQTPLRIRYIATHPCKKSNLG